MKQLIYSNSILYIALGLLSPFWIYKVNLISDGNITKFSIAIGLMFISQSVGAFIYGKKSDNKGRKKTINRSLVLAAISIALLQIATNYLGLIILQVSIGLWMGAAETTIKAYMGDLTEEETRGGEFGSYDAIITLCTGVAMIVAGLLTPTYIFYIVAIMILISVIMLNTNRFKKEV